MKYNKVGLYIILVCSVARYSISSQTDAGSPDNVEESFTNISQKNHRLSPAEKVSCTGSTISDTEKVHERICELLEHFKITSIAATPRGDFHYWMKIMGLGTCKYSNREIVKMLFDKNTELYNKPSGEFTHINLMGDQLDKVDLILCRDILGHLKYKDVFKVLRNFKKSCSRYLLVTHHPELSKNEDLKIEGGWRQINFELPPFNFPKPLASIEEKGNLFDDLGKHLGLWLLDDIKAIDLSIFSVDYEESLGKNDPYMHGFYKGFEAALQDPKPNSSWWMYIPPSSSADFINLCRHTYATIKPTEEDLAKTRIPRVFHQIWVGKKPFPEHYKKWQKTWQSVPGWSYKLWTDEDVEKLDFPNKQLYYEQKNMGARADILRIEILYQFGGLYIDTDFECLKPEYFEVLNSTYDFYSGMTPLDRNVLVVANGLIGAIPFHPILKACRDNLPAYPEAKDAFFAIVNNGPGLLSKMYLAHGNKGYRDVIFPPSFFYTVGIIQMYQEPYLSAIHMDYKFELLKRGTCKPEALAVHWWEGSWTIPDSWE